MISNSLISCICSLSGMNSFKRRTKNVSKLKIIIIEESVSRVIHAFAVHNIHQQQHSKVIQPIKRLKIPKTPVQYTLANTSTGMIMTLIITENSLS